MASLRGPRQYDALNATLIFALAAVLGFAGALLTLVGSHADLLTPSGGEMARSMKPGTLPKVHIWLCSVGLQGSIWCLAAVLIAKWAYQLRAGLLRLVRASLLYLAGLSVVLIGVPRLLAVHFGLFNASDGILDWGVASRTPGGLGVLGNLGPTIAALGFVGVWLLGIEFQLVAESNIRPGLLAKRFVQLRLMLQKVTLLSALTLTAQLLGSMLLQAARRADGQAYPEEYVLISGAFYSVMLLLAYGPTYWYSLEVGDRLADRLAAAALPATGSAPASARFLHPEGVAAAKLSLRLEAGASSLLGNWLPILLPAVSAIGSHLFRAA